MRRRLWTAGWVLSLVLFALASVFWARSHMVGDSLEYRRPPRLVVVDSMEGLWVVGWAHAPASEYNRDTGWTGSFWPFTRQVDTMTRDYYRMTFHGFAIRHDRTSDMDSWLLILPYWFIGLLLLIPSGLRVWGWRVRRAHARRLAAGCCVECGYDLRASVERCPECGTSVSAAKNTAMGREAGGEGRRMVM